MIEVDEDLVDLHRFRVLVAQARASADEPGALALFEQALALWRGEAFAGMDLPWLNELRAGLDEERFTAELDCTDLLLSRGRHTELVAELTGRAGEHPWDERLAGQLMLALYRCGRQADALTHYERTRKRLAEELGVDPGPPLRRLYEQILTADPALEVRTSVTSPDAVSGRPTAAASDGPLERAASELATAITRQWTAEAELRSLHRPAPVHLRWSATTRPVAASASAVLGEQGDPEQPRMLGLRGDLRDLTAKFRALPARQLVVLGEPGAGKTVVAILITLGLLADPVPGEPTPVLLPVSSWNPRHEHLDAWLGRRLVAEYPGLGNRSAYGPDAAARLVAEGRVLPVLDGLDETPPGLHTAALEALDHAVAGGRPLVVTCRSAEYETAVREAGILTRAAVVEIEPVHLDDAVAFLTAHHHAGDTRWQPVVAHLRQHRDGPLSQALSTPLMVDLARTAYRRPGSDPAVLSRFPDRGSIEEHLLDAFVPASYTTRPRPPAARTTRQDDPEQAVRWLAFLAGRPRTDDLVWWKLVHEIPPLTRGIVFGLPPALVFAITGLLVAGPRMALVYGISTGVAGFAASGWGPRKTPMRVVPRFRGTTRQFLARFVVGIAIGLAIGTAWSFPPGAVISLATVFGLGLGLHVWLAAPTDATQSSSPATAQAQDRLAAAAFTLSVAAALGLFYALTITISGPPTGLATVPDTFYPARALPAGLVSALFGWFAFRLLGSISHGLAGFVVGGQAMPHHVPPGLAVVAGVLFGLAIGLIAVQTRAWGTYVFTLTWLALRQRTPLRLNHFLAAAHQRGVLRQAGAVYQFRHVRLQNHLAKSRSR